MKLGFIWSEEAEEDEEEEVEHEEENEEEEEEEEEEEKEEGWIIREGVGVWPLWRFIVQVTLSHDSGRHSRPS